jgi:hypothetical protein
MPVVTESEYDPNICIIILDKESLRHLRYNLYLITQYTASKSKEYQAAVELREEIIKIVPET